MIYWMIGRRGWCMFIPIRKTHRFHHTFIIAELSIVNVYRQRHGIFRKIFNLRQPNLYTNTMINITMSTFFLQPLYDLSIEFQTWRWVLKSVFWSSGVHCQPPTNHKINHLKKIVSSLNRFNRRRKSWNFVIIFLRQNLR